MIVNINGRFVPAEQANINVSDGGLLFGDTLFETIKARGKSVCLRKEHLDRLELSSGLLGLPFDRGAIEKALDETAASLPWPASRLRLTLSRGTGEGLAAPDRDKAWFAITASAYSEPTDEERQHGVTCCLAPNHRVNPLFHLPQMKRGNYADCLYAARHARQQGCREALFIDADGRLQEGATSNLFLVCNGTLVTPPAGEVVLAGIMRGQVLMTARRNGMPVQERSVSYKELFEADEAFLTNSLIGLLPVSSMEGKAINRGDSWSSLHALIQGDERRREQP